MLTGWTPLVRPLNHVTGEIPPGNTNHRTPFKNTPRPLKTNIQGVMRAVREGGRGRGFTRREEETTGFNPVFKLEDLKRFNRKRYSEAKASCKICGLTENLTGVGLCALCDNLFQTTFPNLLGYQENP